MAFIITLNRDQCEIERFGCVITQITNESHWGMISYIVEQILASIKLFLDH